MNLILSYLDYLFHFLHISLILWNLTGWIFQKTRFLHFLSLNLLFFFWFVVGIFYGFGYCPLTHYHWEVKILLGEKNLPNSYITYILQLIGIYLNEIYIDYIVLSITIIVYFISLYFLVKNYKH